VVGDRLGDLVRFSWTTQWVAVSRMRSRPSAQRSTLSPASRVERKRSFAPQITSVGTSTVSVAGVGRSRTIARYQFTIASNAPSRFHARR